MSEADATAGGGGEERRPLTDEERVALYREQVKKTHSLDLVRAMLVDFVTLGYQKLGLTSDTEELRDLADARVAIETLRRLIEVVESEGQKDEAQTYRSTLAAMQMQFAQAASRPQRPPDVPTPDAATEPPATSAKAPETPPPATEKPGAKTKAEVKGKKPPAKPRAKRPAKARAKRPPHKMGGGAGEG